MQSSINNGGSLGLETGTNGTGKITNEHKNIEPLDHVQFKNKSNVIFQCHDCNHTEFRYGQAGVFYFCNHCHTRYTETYIQRALKRMED